MTLWGVHTHLHTTALMECMFPKHKVKPCTAANLLLFRPTGVVKQDATCTGPCS